jgi:hypothetical protein
LVLIQGGSTKGENMCAGAIFITGIDKSGKVKSVAGYGSHWNLAKKNKITTIKVSAEAKMISPGFDVFNGTTVNGKKNETSLAKKWGNTYFKSLNGVIKYIETYGYDYSLLHMLDPDAKKTITELISVGAKSQTVAEAIIAFIKDKRVTFNWFSVNGAVPPVKIKQDKDGIKDQFGNTVMCLNTFDSVFIDSEFFNYEKTKNTITISRKKSKKSK